MKIITSVSGGRTSAYIAANYHSDYLLFALVRIEDQNCKFKDDVLRKRVEDKVQAPFIATTEDDLIITTMFDLEQYLGREIKWVTGLTFEEVIKYKSNYLPNKVSRYCTTHLKLKPMFDWWKSNIDEPIEMQIGFRANEIGRAKGMLSKCDKDGFTSFRTSLEKTKSGKNKWVEVKWQKPSFPLIKDNLYKDSINKYWEDKPVHFAPYNNCVGCFHRNPVFLRYMFQEHPTKMEWFSDQEKKINGYWKSDGGEIQSYDRIKNMLPQMRLYENDFSSCDSGYCGM